MGRAGISGMASNVLVTARGSGIPSFSSVLLLFLPTSHPTTSASQPPNRPVGHLLLQLKQHEKCLMLIGSHHCLCAAIPEVTHPNQSPNSKQKVPAASPSPGPNKAHGVTGLVAKKQPTFIQMLAKLFSLDHVFLQTILSSAQKYKNEHV